MSTVLCVGIAVQDFLFAVETLPDRSGKYYAIDFRDVGGGVAANAAVAVARLGGEARYAGQVGDDALGATIVADLGAAGVDTSRVRPVPGLRSPLSAVLVDAAGERMIVNYTPDGLFVSGDVSPAEDVAGADAVLVDVRWPAGALAALRAARSVGIPSVFDFDRPMDDHGGLLLTEASHVAFSAAALHATTNTTDFEEGLARIATQTAAWVAVTAGEHGVYWRSGDRLHHLPAFAVEVVDTVGAGDIFHGALALALAEGQPEPVAVRFAAAAAAIKCTRRGARAGAPSRAEVEAFLEEAD